MTHEETAMNETLPSEIVWQSDGHLSEVAVTALADGQTSLLAEDAHAHLATCDACTVRLGDAALRSVETAALFAEAAQAAPSSAPSSVRARPFPLLPITLGLVVAMVSALPLLSAVPGKLASAIGAIPEILSPAFARSAALLARALAAEIGKNAAPLSLASLSVLAVSLFLLSRVVRRPSLSSGAPS